MKLGGHFNDDIKRIKQCRSVLDDGDVLIGDANTGWLTHDALKIVKAVEDLDVYIEQPCPTYNECLTIRENCNLPFILDENISELQHLVQLCQDRAADVVNIKISKFGGLTKAKRVKVQNQYCTFKNHDEKTSVFYYQAVEFCSAMGIAMTIEDTWGGDVVTAAILHLAGTVSEKLHFSSTDFNSYNTMSTGRIVGGPKLDQGRRMQVPQTVPGLGVDVDRQGMKPLLQFPSS